jgi:hypothetical protein
MGRRVFGWSLHDNIRHGVILLILDIILIILFLLSTVAALLFSFFLFHDHTFADFFRTS